MSMPPEFLELAAQADGLGLRSVGSPREDITLLRGLG
jgi:hypothetical protein